METQIEKGLGSVQTTKIIYGIGELIMVFLPSFLLVGLTGSWVGDDPMRSMSVIWVANVLIMVMIAIGLKLRGDSWSTLGLTFNSLTGRGVLKHFMLSLLVCAAATLAYFLGGMLMSNISALPESADLSIYNYLKDNLGMLLLSLASVYIVSSFGEELVYRGFMITRLSQLFGDSKWSSVIAVVLSSVFFGLIHFTWGPMGMIQTGFMGLIMGIAYIKLKRKLWILILAHAYMDTYLLVQLYLNL